VGFQVCANSENMEDEPCHCGDVQVDVGWYECGCRHKVCSACGCANGLGYVLITETSQRLNALTFPAPQCEQT
jgi:hypothetical protein